MERGSCQYLHGEGFMSVPAWRGVYFSACVERVYDPLPVERILYQCLQAYFYT